jgi:hypothetical protein
LHPRDYPKRTVVWSVAMVTMDVTGWRWAWLYTYL